MRFLNSFLKYAMFVITLCCILLVSACTKTEEENKENKLSYDMISEKFETEISLDKGEITYPVFKDYPALNEIIKTKIDTIKNNFVLEITEISKTNEGAEQTPAFEFVLSAGDVIISDGYIGFMLSTYTFTGGAHGITRLDAVNFNTKEMKELSLEDILKPLNEDWLSKLSEASINELMKMREVKNEEFFDENAIKTGAGMEVNNFKNFNIVDENVMIIFDQYQVAPYSSGMPKIMIPLSFFK